MQLRYVLPNDWLKNQTFKNSILEFINLYRLFFYQQGGDKYFISCPSCRKPTQLPDIGATDLPNAFFINRLLQLQDKLKKISCEVNIGCQIHYDPLKIYCETCEELICRDCAVTRPHQNHKYKLVDECYPDHQQEIEAHLTTVKTKVTYINTAVTNLINREKEITKHGEDVKKEIRIQAQEILNLVQQSERQLVQQVDNAIQLKTQLLTKQREEAELVLNQLKCCEEFVEQSLKVGSQQHILREKQNMIQVMTRINQGVNPIVFQPIEEANVIFARNQTLIQGIGEIGKAVVVKNSCHLGKKSTIALNLQTCDGSPFSVPLHRISFELFSSDSSRAIPRDIKETQPGIYNISFIPLTIGKYQLKLKLDGVDIPGSPFTLSPELKGKPVTIISGLNEPWGVVVTKNKEFVIAENGGNCVTILNRDWRKVKSFGRKEKKKCHFTSPRGVAISHDGHILVTDEHRLQKLTFEGDFVKSVGNEKIGLQFNDPVGIAVHPNTGQIYIADRYNHRIVILNNDLSYSTSFGSYGSEPEQFKQPLGLNFDKEGYLYVVDANNHCIKKFTSTGQYISKFGSKGSNSGQLYVPTSITIDNNLKLLYVTELHNNRISVFDTSGCFIYCFGKYGRGEGEFNNPYFITVDSLCNLYVSDTWNNRL